MLLTVVCISIHAPRVGSDGGDLNRFEFGNDFNPRSPRGERRSNSARSVPFFVFQSTLPAWGATCPCRAMRKRSKFQSTLPAWGATMRTFTPGACWASISIPAPRVGSDHVKLFGKGQEMNFNPRSPRGERPTGMRPRFCKIKISIHAPRVGSDADRVCAAVG